MRRDYKVKVSVIQIYNSQQAGCLKKKTAVDFSALYIETFQSFKTTDISMQVFNSFLILNP